MIFENITKEVSFTTYNTLIVNTLLRFKQFFPKKIYLIFLEHIKSIFDDKADKNFRHLYTRDFKNIKELKGSEYEKRVKSLKECYAL